MDCREGGRPIVELLLILLFILLNGIFAMAEAALISSRRARLQQRANQGDERARVALELANAPDKFLATTQIAISLVGILSGAFGGATLAEPLGKLIAAIPPLAPYAEAIAFGGVVLAITYISLIVGELVPKQLALNNPEGITMRLARPMQTLSRLASPLVRLLNGSSNLVIRLLGIRPSNEPGVTEEEIKVMLEQGALAGTFEEGERFLVNRVFRLGDLRVSAIMTPRKDVTWLDVDDPPAVIREKVARSGRSRFPVAQDGLDNVIGVVRAKDILIRTLPGAEAALNLRDIVLEPLFVPDTITLLQMLQRFLESSTHLALVIDEYGGLEGILTITDVLEEIIGGEYLSEESPRARIVRREDGSWLLDGLITVDELKDTLRLRALPGEEDGDFQTLGGFIMKHIGRIPTPSDHFEAAGYRFEVVDMDDHRVDKVLAIPLDAGTS